MASTYRYAVKVLHRPGTILPGLMWGWRCPCCLDASSFLWVRPGGAREAAARHAANCEDLHRANRAAACPSCKMFGKVAPACPVCLGRGWVK